MFFSDLGVPPNLISGAERGREKERWRKRLGRMQRKAKGVRDGKDERRDDEKRNKGKRQCEKTGTKQGTDPRASPLFLVL